MADGSSGAGPQAKTDGTGKMNFLTIDDRGTKKGIGVSTFQVVRLWRRLDRHKMQRLSLKGWQLASGSRRKTSSLDKTSSDVGKYWKKMLAVGESRAKSFEWQISGDWINWLILYHLMQGMIVAVKAIPKTKVELNRPLLLELKRVNLFCVSWTAEALIWWLPSLIDWFCW